MRRIDAAVFDEKTAFFDQMARSSWFVDMQDEMAGATADRHVLDVGCGTGRMLGRWHGQYASGTGMDFSSAMIDSAEATHQSYSGLTFVNGSVEDMPFHDSTFDVVTAVCVFFLLPDPQPAIRESARVLKAGGKLLMLNPAVDFTADLAAQAAMDIPDQEKPMMQQWGEIAERRHRFTEEELMERLHQEGFADMTFKRTANGFGMITSAVFSDDKDERY